MMKHSHFLKWSVVPTLLTVFLWHTAFAAVTFPTATGYVNDFAGILSAEDKNSLETALTNFEKTTSNEITVAIVPSLQGLDEFTYAQDLFTQWKIGKANKNNGVLFLIAPTERRYFINVGKGLEGALPDSMVGTIGRQEVVPQFKNGDFAAGITNGVNALMEASKGEYQPTPDDTQSQGTDWLDAIGGSFVALLFLGSIIMFINHVMRYTKSWWFGGVVGFPVGALIAAHLSLGGVFFWICIGVFMALGLGYDYTVSKGYAKYKAEYDKPVAVGSSRKRGGFWWFGGGGFGGGGSGGGFGGFGGGGSGGGGAGGGW